MKKTTARKLRDIPAVEKVLQAIGPSDVPRPVLTQVIRAHLAQLRTGEIPGLEEIMIGLRDRVAEVSRTRLQTVINGTGVLIHTNLGRSPLASEAAAAVANLAGSYNNLEFNLGTGQRGGRAEYLESLLALLCGAPAATVVNNCAAALILILRNFVTTKPEVVISRGELVQIGGGFRVPEILETSGAVLREVGATNRTTVRDYERAIGERTGLILQVHRSNFYMGGFVESPDPRELAALAKQRGVPMAVDLGSGAVVPTSQFAGLGSEPSPADVLKQGADLVCCSGDKLFGGPQAGIIAGGADHVRALKSDPFFRALRCDKLVFAALQATAELHLKNPGAGTGIPIYEMLRATPAALQARAEALVARLTEAGLRSAAGQCEGQVGGGTLPQAIIPSICLDVWPKSDLDGFAARLRHGAPPVIGFINDNRFRLDLRTVFPDQDAALGEVLVKAAGVK